MVVPLTGTPENVILAIEVFSLFGIQAEKTVETAGHMHPCKPPNTIRISINMRASPHRTQTGVISVSSDADNIITTNIDLPPMRSAINPAGM